MHQSQLFHSNCAFASTKVVYRTCQPFVHSRPFLVGRCGTADDTAVLNLDFIRMHCSFKRTAIGRCSTADDAAVTNLDFIRMHCSFKRTADEIGSCSTADDSAITNLDFIRMNCSFKRAADKIATSCAVFSIGWLFALPCALFLYLVASFTFVTWCWDTSFTVCFWLSHAESFGEFVAVWVSPIFLYQIQYCFNAFFQLFGKILLNLHGCCFSIFCSCLAQPRYSHTYNHSYMEHSSNRNRFIFRACKGVFCRRRLHKAENIITRGLTVRRQWFVDTFLLHCRSSSPFVAIPQFPAVMEICLHVKVFNFLSFNSGSVFVICFCGLCAPASLGF